MRETIRLTSPNKTTFVCKWRGDSRSKDKSLGRFKTPRTQGEKIQDMDVNAATLTTSIYIDDPDYIKTGEKFWKACSENGKWTILHPVKGTLKNQQLSSVTENINTVSESGFLKYDLVFIESLDRFAFFGQVVKNLVSSLASLLPGTTIAAYSAAARLDTSAGRIDVVNAVTVVITSLTTWLLSVTRSSTTVNTNVNTALATLGATVADINFTADSVATQIYNVIQSTIPQTITTVSQSGQVTTETGNVSAQNIYTGYTNFINGVLENTPNADQQGGGFNTALTNELIASATLAAMCQAFVNTKFQTQQQALSMCDLLYDFFYQMRETLDGYQSLYDAYFIEYRFFSMTETYYTLVELVTNTCKYLVQESFSLKKEKRYILKTDMNTLTICWEQYGGIGENQENFNLLIDSNGFTGYDILRLKAGREVLVYA